MYHWPVPSPVLWSLCKWSSPNRSQSNWRTQSHIGASTNLVINAKCTLMVSWRLDTISMSSLLQARQSTPHVVQSSAYSLQGPMHPFLLHLHPDQILIQCALSPLHAACCKLDSRFTENPDDSRWLRVSGTVIVLQSEANSTYFPSLRINLHGPWLHNAPWCAKNAFNFLLSFGLTYICFPGHWASNVLKQYQTCVWMRPKLTDAKTKDVRTSSKSSEFLSTWHLHAVANTRAETQSVPSGFGNVTAVKLCNLLL